MKFEWDSWKAKRNLAKHKVSFEEAATAMLDPLSKTVPELRPEYKRSDFGELVRGKYAATQVEFTELVSLLMSCIGEDEDVKFIYHSKGDTLARGRSGDWTYEFDNANQITLRYWLDSFRSLEVDTTNPPCITSHEEYGKLQ